MRQGTGMRLVSALLALAAVAGGCVRWERARGPRREAPRDGLVAHWVCDQDAGAVLADRSGNDHRGTIHNARWVRTASGPALAFSGANSYVDFGNDPHLKLSGDFAFSAWIRLDAEPYPDATTNWHLFGWETYTQSGATCRLAGSTAQLYFRASHDGVGNGRSEGLAETRLANRTYYHSVIVKQGGEAALYVDGRLDGRLPVQDPAANDLPFTLSTAEQSFAGSMDNVRLYARALSAGEVVALYQEGGAAHGKDVSWIGKLKLTPFVHYDEQQAVVEADLRGVLPLQAGERICVELRQAGKPVAPRQERPAAPESGREDFSFDLRGLAPGACEVRVAVGAGDRVRAQAALAFPYPAPKFAPPAPAAARVAALPVAPPPPPYALELGEAGGFSVRLGRESYAVESIFSYPHGGENRLAVGGQAAASGEKGWTVRTDKTVEGVYRTVASGAYYRLTREIEAQRTRILVRDRIENLTDADLGLAVDNRLVAPAGKDVDLQALAAPQPPVFSRAGDRGMGLVPLNDLYQVSQRTYTDPKGRVCGAKVPGLGIPKGGSQTLEWAVYPVGSGDYYDLINAIRRDEGLNDLTVDGCLALGHAGQWQREPPPAELVRFAGLKYAANGGLMHVADDPEISFQGIEFGRSTQEKAALRATYAETRKRFSGLKLGFHIAYNIYATNEPAQFFPDSRVLASSGKHGMYGSPVSCFSAARRAQGWAFFPYYPTLTNGFGRELLRSADVMLDDIGADMVWADGLLAGYGAEMGDYPTGYLRTLEPWDGSSVELDPATQTIARKYGLVVSLGKEALVEYIQRINAKGGRVWINHGAPVPRSFAHLGAYWVCETMDGNQRIAALHLAPGAPHALHTPGKPLTPQGVYDEVRAKLSWGAMYVYFWMYGATQLTQPLITTEMYPLTVESIHPGWIQGRERIITLHAGVYGWPDDRHLHLVRRFDARGRLTAPAFLSTVDQAGTRTRLDLAEGQTAIVIKLPVVLQAARPVNLCVTRFENGELELTLNGKGAVVLQFEGAAPECVSGAPARIEVAARRVSLELAGPVALRLQPGLAPGAAGAQPPKAE